MSDLDPPIEQQRFARSQTPESPRPVHLPEPSTIPVLLNQMDPVFNDTATYNIPSNQTFSPYGETLENNTLQNSSNDEHDAVQSFFREAENEASTAPLVPNAQSEVATASVDTHQLPSAPTIDQSATDQSNSLSSQAQSQINPFAEKSDDNGWQGTRKDAAGDQAISQNDGEASHDQGGMTDQEQEQSNHAQSHELSGMENSGVDYQSLLDTISKSASTAPAAEAMTAPTTGPSHGDQLTGSLPSFPGLPPKPPPQESPAEFPTYPEHPQASAYSFPSSAQDEVSQSALLNGQSAVNHSNLPNSFSSYSATGETPANPFDLQNAAIVQSTSAYPQPPSIDQAPLIDSSDGYLDPTERPWTPGTRAAYEAFLDDERRYVTEGIWDRFPVGSRLFVGNLPSEKVTKRDLFHYFHPHGRLAQISIKQAYGFVQYHDAASCLAALNAKQGVEIRGRKVHLEISKPQKNTRGAGAAGTKTQARRRSRSPDRNQRRFNNFREDSGRRRDEFRNRRSPSPRTYHSRDDFRPGSTGRDDRRSPIYGSNYGSAPGNPYTDDESNLPIPRRDPRNVPDVQVIVMDQSVHQSFINWVEDGFRRKGLQASTIWMGPRLSLAAVVKRQIMEGVQAVVKLTAVAQSRSKIPLQVFDRTAGISNVNFNEYGDLDVPVAADVVIQARQREQQTRAPYTAGFHPPSPYGQPPPTMPFPPPAPPPFPQQSHQSPTMQQPFQYPPPQSGHYRPPAQPTQAPPTPASQPPNLQELLANLKGSNNPPTPQSAQSANSRPDLAGFLSNIGRQQGQSLPASPYGIAQPYPNFNNQPGYPTQQSPLQQQQQQQQQPGTQQSNVQNIMAELARYQR